MKNKTNEKSFFFFIFAATNVFLGCTMQIYDCTSTHPPPPTQALSQSSVKPVTEKGKENSQKY